MINKNRENKDLNSKIENHIFIGTEISKTINSIPIALDLEFNNYLNYQKSKRHRSYT